MGVKAPLSCGEVQLPEDPLRVPETVCSRRRSAVHAAQLAVTECSHTHALKPQSRNGSQPDNVLTSRLHELSIPGEVSPQVSPRTGFSSHLSEFVAYITRVKNQCSDTGRTLVRQFCWIPNPKVESSNLAGGISVCRIVTSTKHFQANVPNTCVRSCS